MKTITLYLLGALLLGALLFTSCQPRDTYDPIAAAHADAEAQRIAQQAQLDAQAAPIVATAWLVTRVAFILMLPIGVGLAGAYALARFRNERRPDDRGLLPVLWRDQGAAVAALGSFHQAANTRASIAPVPASISTHYAPAPHYAPALHYRADRNGVLGDVVDEQPTALPLPGLTDLATIAHTPTPQSILLALGAGGTPITVPAKALCHVALCGATGQGKSNLLRLLLPQLQAMGARVVLADPHYTDLDPESGDDWRPIRQRLHMPPAVAPRDIDELLSWLTAELDQRLTLRGKGQPWGKPLFLALDELPVIVENVKDVPDRLGRVLREGRKVGVLVVGASQEFLVKTIGGSGAARDAYRTSYYVGGDLVSARTLLDMPQREIDEGALVQGVAYLRSVASSPAHLVRVPYASNGAIAHLLGAGEPPYEPPHEPVYEPPTAWRPNALNPRAEQVRQMMALKAGVNEIIKEVWQVGGKGAAYQQALEELRDIQAQLAARAGG